MTTRLRWGLKGKHQLPLLMIWREHLEGGDVVAGTVIFNSRRWIGV